MNRNRIVGVCGLLSLAWTVALPGADSCPAPETFQNSLGMKFVRIQAGSFRMGSLATILRTSQDHGSS